MRYTHKLKKSDGNYNYFLIPIKEQCDDAENKLGQLEDIEEELGIDLITLFKALKNGIWVKYDSDFGITGKPKIKIVKDTATEICFRNGKWYIQEGEELLKNYGKTWALTKEELL